MKNHFNQKPIIAYIGTNSFLAKNFISKYKNKFIFKPIKSDITNTKKINKWIKNNKDINIFINFAAIASVSQCERNKKKALKVNCNSVISILKLIKKIKPKNFKYFLVLSSSHVFKPSINLLKENSIKKPNNFYGLTKLKLENYILKNQNKFYYKIGIGRIFNYYNKKKGFFINDIIKKLSNKRKKIFFSNTNTFRDFISINDINSAIYKMITLNLKNDFNICSGKKIYLPKIINYINRKLKNKILYFDNKNPGDIVGSNKKLLKKGWTLTKMNFLNEVKTVYEKNTNNR